MSNQSSLNFADYIYEKWGISASIEFVDKIDILTGLLATNKKLCPKSLKKSFRKCVVTKQVSLVYTISKDIIHLIAFVDNRSNHHF